MKCRERSAERELRSGNGAESRGSRHALSVEFLSAAHSHAQCTHRQLGLGENESSVKIMRKSAARACSQVIDSLN